MSAAPNPPLRAPMVYFGGSLPIAPVVWGALGTVGVYAEPFMGSLAVLLNRPAPFTGREIANDADGLLVNAFRAMRSRPDEVAAHADHPPMEADLHARHLWLVGHRADITAKLMGDPDWCDARAAGWWLWGNSNWIGSGWCTGEGPWVARDGELVDSRADGQLPHATEGRGVNRKLPHATGGRGVNRQLPHATGGQGGQRAAFLADLLPRIAARLEYTVILCGDWQRAVTDGVRNGDTMGVFLDPPYTEADNVESLGSMYAGHDGRNVAAEARAWALAHGDDPAYRIVLKGYAEEHDAMMPANWTRHRWSSSGGYARADKGNRHRECLWLSPHCLVPEAHAQHKLSL